MLRAMAASWERALSRWVSAGLLDAATAERIAGYERSRDDEAGLRWPVALALAGGGLLIGAGVLLFVSAHWDQLRPASRMSIIAAAVALFHVAGALVRERFAALATTLHAVGTVALGGGIAMAGQIFHMEEHWSGATLLWAIGAAAAAWILRDWPQIAFTAILVPAWLIGEWQQFHRGDVTPSIFALMTALTYLSARRKGEPGGARQVLEWIGALATLPAGVVAALVAMEGRGGREPVAGIAAALLLPLVAAWWLRRQAAWMNAVSAVWCAMLPLVSAIRLELVTCVWGAVASLGVAAWGVQERRALRINLGMAGFAITVLYFYFSSVMDRLGRSASLIGLGVLFLAGGWAWERARRRLVAGTREGGV
jgi:uncharacterized membrane protein